MCKGPRQRKSNGQQSNNGAHKQQQQQQSKGKMLPSKTAKKKQQSSKKGSTVALVGCGLCALLLVLAIQWYMTALPEPAPEAAMTRPPKPKSAKRAKEAKEPKSKGASKKRASLEWTTLSRDYDGCMTQQHELMTVPEQVAAMYRGSCVPTWPAPSQ